MKQVINTKLYDTESAEQIAKHSNHAPTSDYNYLRETLYKTDSGQYFLHGRGGAASKYARSTGDGLISSEEIIVMSDEEALSWCEERQIDGEIVAEEFDELVEEA